MDPAHSGPGHVLLVWMLQVASLCTETVQCRPFSLLEWLLHGPARISQEAKNAGQETLV